MSTEQVEDYDTLYDKGFTDGLVDSPNESEEETLEQPEELEEESTEETLDEEIETDTTDEDEEDSKEESNEDENDSEETQEEEPFIEVERYGQVIKMNKEEAKKFASFGFDYTAKTQDLSSKRQVIELLDDMSLEEVKTMKDAFGGDKEAIAHFLKSKSIDPYDIDTDETKYQPEVEKINYELNDAIEYVKKDTEIAPIIDTWINGLPQSVHGMIAKDPKILTDLYQEAKSGMAQKVMPNVFKQMALNPNLDFKQAYMDNRRVVAEAQQKEEVPSSVKKKATVTKKQPTKKKLDHRDVWEDEDLYREMHRMLAEKQ